MSKMIKVLFMIAITMAIAITLTVTLSSESKETTLNGPQVVNAYPKRVSRFLAETKNPRAADHCNKDNEICYYLEGKNSTCCNNKCMDLSEDKHNCGACKNKCKFTSSCCRGECVNLAYDKRHCGSCGNKCMPGGYCIYGLCNYA
ncbi:stigma-specific Stig1 family protein [Artemisia annua]|uniref:Stigma-specific Stig1 family protein n=1 Tax=Artemisia annua TaxID=35608 RepID=A0A2U1LAF4_ARTAN|nr:stigma-specific Stig1 family protein [Artemisia annua]